jgi:hypothetical protein
MNGGRWLERHRKAAERRPRIRLDRFRMAPLARGYDVVVEGFNLRRWLGPPRVTVGGVLVRRLQLQPDGRVVSGVLSEEPRGRRLDVDFGFDRATLEGPQSNGRSHPSLP